MELVEELEREDKDGEWFIGLKVLDFLPWKAYGIPGLLVGFFTFNLETKAWEGHMYASHQCRGLEAKRYFKAILEMFFSDTGQSFVIGVTPKKIKQAVVMARALGFKFLTETPEMVVSILYKEGLKCQQEQH